MDVEGRVLTWPAITAVTNEEAVERSPSRVQSAADADERSASTEPIDIRVDLMFS